MMVKQKRAQLYLQVVDQLRASPKNIHQLSQATNTNWETVHTIVESLRVAQLIDQQGKQYSMSYLPSHPDTIMGFPLEEEKKTLLCQLAKRVQELSKKPLTNVAMQHILVALIKKEHLDIPCGRYLFGQSTVLQLHPSTYEQYDSINSFDNSVKPLINEYSQYASSRELLRAQSSDDQSYRSRVKLDLLFKQPCTAQALELIELELQDVLFRFKRTSDNEDMYEFMSGFFVMFSRLRKQVPLDELEELRLELYSAYTIVWEFMSSYQFYHDIKPFYTYDPAYFFLQRKKFLHERANTYFDFLNNHLPRTNISPLRKRIRESRSS